MTISRFPKMTCPKPRPYLTGWAIAVLAAGCGGGGDDTSNDSTHEVAEVAAMHDPVFAEAEPGADATESALRRRTTPPPPAPTGVTCGLPDFQASALARINQYRASGADCRSAGRFASVQPLVWESRLAQAAVGHSQDMAVKSYFSHTSPTGSTMVSRINATGYSWSTIGENIAAGYPTVNAVIDGWMSSDGHCANLMNPNFRDAALACVASSTSTYRTYWTLDLGRQR